MSIEKQKQGIPQTGGPVHHIRLILTSRKVKPLERVSKAFLDAAADQKMRRKGPRRMPTKTLRITTRKSPCGQGTETWDRFEMRIHKRVIDVWSSTELVQKITDIDVDADVDIVVTIV